MSAGSSSPQVVPLLHGGASYARSALERSIAAGGVVVFPSDGVYGLACDPLDPGAIARIHRIKGRDDGKPAAVMYFSPLAMRELVAELGPRAAARPGHPGRPHPRPSLSARLPRGRRAARCPPPVRAAGRGDVPDLPDLCPAQRESG